MEKSFEELVEDGRRLINDCLMILGIRKDDAEMLRAVAERCRQYAMPAGVAAGAAAGAAATLLVPGVGALSAVSVALLAGYGAWKATRLYCETIMLPVLKKARDMLWQDVPMRALVKAELLSVVAHHRRAIGSA